MDFLETDQHKHGHKHHLEQLKELKELKDKLFKTQI